MDSNEMLSQILAAMQEQTEVLTKMMDDKIQGVREEIQDVRGEIQAVETRINVKIENDVAKRIDSLFDGYKLAHEKQWELERKVEAMERRLEALESKAG